MNFITTNGYRIAGNAYLAIAININDDTDVHYFTISAEIPDAFNRAIAWSSPGI